MKNEIANKITGTYDLCRSVSSSDDRLFTVGEEYNNNGKTESWTGRDGSFDPENNFGYLYVIYAKNVQGHEVDYDNEEEVAALDAFDSEGEVLVPAETKLIVTRISSDEDYEEQGYYEVNVQVI